MRQPGRRREETAITTKRLTTRAILRHPETRATVAQRLRQSYEQGADIRQLAHETGYAYGTVRTLLTEAGTTFRPRGRPSKQT